MNIAIIAASELHNNDKSRSSYSQLVFSYSGITFSFSGQPEALFSSTLNNTAKSCSGKDSK